MWGDWKHNEVNSVTKKVIVVYKHFCLIYGATRVIYTGKIQIWCEKRPPNDLGVTFMCILNLRISSIIVGCLSV